jgi:hypothetical protein
MEMQTLKDSSNPVFVVTDLLRGVRYFVADKGSHYEIQVPRKAGYIRVAVSREADVIDIASTNQSGNWTPQKTSASLHTHPYNRRRRRVGWCGHRNLNPHWRGVE